MSIYQFGSVVQKPIRRRCNKSMSPDRYGNIAKIRGGTIYSDNFSITLEMPIEEGAGQFM